MKIAKQDDTKPKKEKKTKEKLSGKITDEKTTTERNAHRFQQSEIREYKCLVKKERKRGNGEK